MTFSLLLILAMLLGGCDNSVKTLECTDKCTVKELQMCGDGIVRERCAGNKGCDYLRAVCYSRSAVEFQKMLGPKDHRKRVKEWENQGLVSCDKIPSYKQHPYIP